MQHLLLAALLVSGAALTSSAAPAQELTGTLKKIKERGAITLSHRETSIPFSYYDNDQKVVGYSNDLAHRIVDGIKADLKMDNIKVELVPVTSQTRIPLLLNNTIDLVCGTMTNNTERQRQVDFSTNFFVIGTRLLTRKNSGINDFADLNGKNVVVSAGTTSERYLRKVNEEKQLGMRIISAKDHGEAFVTVEFNKAVAFMSDDAILYGEISKAKNASEWHIVGTAPTREVYACAMRKGDAPFKAAVDKQIGQLMKSGEIVKIYDKWFRSPIPPRGVNLNVPLNDDLKELFANPNDTPLQ